MQLVDSDVRFPYRRSSRDCKESGIWASRPTSQLSQTSITKSVGQLLSKGGFVDPKAGAV